MNTHTHTQLCIHTEALYGCCGSYIPGVRLPKLHSLCNDGLVLRELGGSVEQRGVGGGVGWLVLTDGCREWEEGGGGGRGVQKPALNSSNQSSQQSSGLQAL